MNQLLDLFLPTPCIGCHKPGSPFCTKCQSEFLLARLRVSKAGRSGFAFTSYNSLAADIVNAIKESGQTSLIGPVASLMAKSWPKELVDVVLVPVPSSPANYKRRGYQHTLKLANALEKRIPGVTTRALLSSARERGDQVNLSPVERKSNLENAFSVDLRGFRDAGALLVLVDDVITTGATINAASSALEAAGLSVTGFCVFAETRAKDA